MFVSMWMTTDLMTTYPQALLADVAALMASRKIRHLPVVDEDRLVGIISIRDLTNWAMQELTAGHELPDLERSHTALSAAAELNRPA